MRKETIILFAVGSILLLGGFFRFFQIEVTPPGLYPDEAMNGNNALEAIATGDFKIFYPENNGREGLFINIQALSLWLFGNEPWALRLISAVFGTLTILGIYLLTRELFTGKNLNDQKRSGFRNFNLTENLDLGMGIHHGKIVALLSSFFLATSFWHINFSRIGFRAIMVPFLASFGLYFLLKGLRRGNILDLVWAGVFIGLGFHTYIAFRLMPFVVAAPLLWYLWNWWKNKASAATDVSLSKKKNRCIPCSTLLFLFITFVVALPVGFYFLQNPQDFIGRAGGVSIFSADSPLKEFAMSNVATLGMFFVQGDCNWRHNYDCQPQLHPIVTFFLAVGLITIIRELLRKTTNYKLQTATVLAWFFFMMLPATLTREGLPHALRAIGMIPPVMILAGIGAWRMWEIVYGWFEKQKEKWPQYVMQLSRIERELVMLGVLLLLLIPLKTYQTYFVHWAQNPYTYFSFATDLSHLGEYLETAPREVKKYVVVNLPGVDVRGIPMPAQTVMFLTDTFREEKRGEKNIYYLLPHNLDGLPQTNGQKTIIAFLDGSDRKLILALQKKNPDLKVRAPRDFVVLQN